MDDLIFLLSTTLMYSTPLIFTALGGMLSEKSGVINIGLEGMMTIGAFMASLAAIKSQSPWLGLIAGGAAGLLLSSLHAVASIKFKASQVVSGMAINFLGSGFSIFLCRLVFEGTSMTPPLDLEQKVPTYGGQYITVYLAIFLTAALWFLLNKTVFGLRLISTGEHPEATDAAGLKRSLYKSAGVLSSGFLAGVGGASLSIAIVSNFRPTLISGQGFIAIAAMIFGKWKPVQTTLACLFFGLSQALVIFLGSKPELQVSSQLLSLLPYAMTLLILVGFMGKTTAPSALGK